MVQVRGAKALCERRTQAVGFCCCENKGTEASGCGDGRMIRSVSAAVH